MIPLAILIVLAGGVLVSVLVSFQVRLAALGAEVKRLAAEAAEARRLASEALLAADEARPRLPESGMGGREGRDAA